MTSITKMKSGIYQIRNILNNKSYIGSAKNLKIREREHFLDLEKNQHSNKHLQNAFNKYGKKSFVFEILAKCPQEYIIKLEQWFLDNTKNKYNILEKAGNSLGYKFSEEVIKTRVKTRKQNLVSNGTYKHLDRTKIQIGNSLRGKEINYKDYEQTCINRRKASTTKKPIIQYDLKMNPIREWESLRQINQELGFIMTNIKNVCNGKKKTCKSFIWRYKNVL